MRKQLTYEVFPTFWGFFPLCLCIVLIFRFLEPGRDSLLIHWFTVLALHWKHLESIKKVFSGWFPPQRSDLIGLECAWTWKFCKLPRPLWSAVWFDSCLSVCLSVSSFLTPPLHLNIQGLRWNRHSAVHSGCSWYP